MPPCTSTGYCEIDASKTSKRTAPAGIDEKEKVPSAPVVRTPSYPSPAAAGLYAATKSPGYGLESAPCKTVPVTDVRGVEASTSWAVAVPPGAPINAVAAARRRVAGSSACSWTVPTGTELNTNVPSTAEYCAVRKLESVVEAQRTIAFASETPVESLTLPRIVPRPCRTTSTCTTSPFVWIEPTAYPFEPVMASKESIRNGRPSCFRTNSTKKVPVASVVTTVVEAAYVSPERSSVDASETLTGAFESGAPSGPRTLPSSEPPATARRGWRGIPPVQLSPAAEGTAAPTTAPGR